MSTVDYTRYVVREGTTDTMGAALAFVLDTIADEHLTRPVVHVEPVLTMTVEPDGSNGPETERFDVRITGEVTDPSSGRDAD